jgi:plasmid stabilization system protein ParE
MLIIRKEAEQDIKNAFNWYEEQRPDLGSAFLAEIESALERIENNPDLYAPVFRNVRRNLARRFPYSVYYLPVGDDVVVIAVLHQRRNPLRWQSRK